MQSKTILLALAATLVFSCSRSNFYEHQPLSVLPTTSHNGPIEVFYEDGNSPQKDYIEFYDLRIVKKGNFSDRDMVRFLKLEAQKKGLDAIAELKTWDESEERASFLDVIATITDENNIEYASTVNYSIIEGKGIKYVDNIDLSKSVKTGRVYLSKDNSFMGEIRFLPNGQIEETTAENDIATHLLDTYYKLSEDHLLHEQKNWQTLHHPDGRIDVRRKYRMSDWLLERVRVRYDGINNRIRNIRLTENPNAGELITKIDYKYNKAGQLVERKAAGSINLKEKLSYEQGMVKTRSVYFGGAEYRIEYDFYQQTDLQNLIRKVEETTE